MLLHDIDITLFCCGNKHEFEKVYTLFFIPLVNFSNRLVNNRYDAEDVVGKVFENMLCRKNDFKSIAKLKSFLFTSTKNMSLKYVRYYRIRTIKHINYSYITKSSYTPKFIDDIIMRERVSIVHQNLKTLSPNERRVFDAYYKKDMSWTEITEEFKMNNNNVGMYKSRAESKIKKSIFVQ